MESSRIFVKGLPPNLSSNDFRQHFAKQSAITDAKFIPHRRIGYVGYKTIEDAAKAVKYHNKSFIRMSKISVELARSVEDQYDPRLKIHEDVQEQGATDTSDNAARKRKLDGPAELRDNPKLEEYLEVMRPPSKSKIWENQDAEISRVSARSIPSAEDAMKGAASSEDSREHMPKQRKREPQGEENAVMPAKPPVPVDVPSVDAGTMPNDGDLSQEVSLEPLKESLVVSDADWLRSRTSRLLGLIDDDGVQPATLREDAPTGKAGLCEVAELVKEGTMSDASVQTDEEVEVEGAVLEDDIAGSGRLFVRNLTYTTTEEDLRKHFEDQGYGNIEEVS